MARGLMSPLLGGASGACADTSKPAMAMVTTLDAKARMEEMRRVAARERESMRYFTLITKYAHYGRVAQGAFHSSTRRDRFLLSMLGSEEYWKAGFPHVPEEQYEVEHPPVFFADFDGHRHR